MVRDGPNIAGIAALIGDAARAEMLAALLAGPALTATELAGIAGVTRQTASAHLARLVDSQLVDVERQGRHRYFRLAGPEVAHALESLMDVAARTGAMRVRPGPREPALRKARACYDHLAGELGVLMCDSLVAQRLLHRCADQLTLAPAARAFFTPLGINVDVLAQQRRPLCRACLDWSMRRPHLAGALGVALLTRAIALGWARRLRGTRIIEFTPPGEAALRSHFVIPRDAPATHARPPERGALHTPGTASLR
ncbi:MAG: helix-turn-helix domain-containing protein [Casimicrobiaceae bacterium]